MTAVTDTIRNGVDTEQLFSTLDLIKDQPELASSSSAPPTAGSTAPITDRRSRGSTPRVGRTPPAARSS